MTVSSETNKDSYVGDNTSTVFPYTFRILDDDQVTVTKKNIETGVVDTLTIVTDYTIDGVGNESGGNITLAATSDSDYTYIFTRNVPFTQGTDYNEFDTFPAESHESALDKLTMMVQQLKEQVDRALKVDVGSGLSGELETPEDSAGLVVKVNGAGTGFEYGNIPGSSYSFPLATTGFLVQTGTNTATTRAIQGTSGEISSANPDGVSGNTVLSLPSTLTLTGKTINDGTFNDGVFNDVTLNNPTIVGAPGTDTGDFEFTDNSATVSGTDDPMLLVANGTGYLGLTSSDIRLLSDQPIVDSSGNEFIKFSKTASAVNEFTVVNAATGNAPILKSSGQSDKGITLSDSNNNELLKMVSTASAVNEFTITNKATGVAPIFQSSGEANTGWKFADSNGNTILQGNSAASAVNYIIVKNKATGTSAAIAASGDANRGISFEDSNGATNLRLNSVAGAGNYVVISNDSGNFPSVITSGSTADLYLTFANSGLGHARFFSGLGAGAGNIMEWIRNGASGSLLHNVNNATATRTIVWPNTDIATSGWTVQRANTQTGAVATGTTTVPWDDTIPQNTQGDEYMTCSITPKSTTNKLVISVTVFASHSAGAVTIISSLHQDSTADALACAYIRRSTATDVIPMMTFSHTMAAGTTSSTTFKVRVGGDTAGTITFNGVSGGRKLGGVLASSIEITEYAA